jgi:hypothetical protein
MSYENPEIIQYDYSAFQKAFEGSFNNMYSMLESKKQRKYAMEQDAEDRQIKREELAETRLERAQKKRLDEANLHLNAEQLGQQSVAELDALAKSKETPAALGESLVITSSKARDAYSQTFLDVNDGRMSSDAATIKRRQIESNVKETAQSSKIIAQGITNYAQMIKDNNFSKDSATLGAMSIFGAITNGGIKTKFKEETGETVYEIQKTKVSADGSTLEKDGEPIELTAKQIMAQGHALQMKTKKDHTAFYTGLQTEARGNMSIVKTSNKDASGKLLYNTYDPDKSAEWLLNNTAFQKHIEENSEDIWENEMDKNEYWVPPGSPEYAEQQAQIAAFVAERMNEIEFSKSISNSKLGVANAPRPRVDNPSGTKQTQAEKKAQKLAWIKSFKEADGATKAEMIKGAMGWSNVTDQGDGVFYGPNADTQKVNINKLSGANLDAYLERIYYRQIK